MVFSDGGGVSPPAHSSLTFEVSIGLRRERRYRAAAAIRSNANTTRTPGSPPITSAMMDPVATWVVESGRLKWLEVRMIAAEDARRRSPPGAG